MQIPCKEVNSKLAKSWNVGLDVDGIRVDETCDLCWGEEITWSKVTAGVALGLYVENIWLVAYTVARDKCNIFIEVIGQSLGSPA